MATGRIRERSWYHTIEFPDGTTTPGYFDTRCVPREIVWPPGLVGGRCLDVGTFDGFWAFEMERRGAREVVAIDIDDPEQLDWRYDERRSGPADVRAWGAERGPGFEEARRRLGSRVEKIVTSVYDLDPERHGRFDVVFCGALLLHLRDPFLALERMREVCAGELVLVETIDATLEIVAKYVPCARISHHRDQWWRVNLGGLLMMLDIAGFEVVWRGRRIVVPYGAGVTHRTRYTLEGLVALRPFAKGALMVPVRARPRPPRGG